MNGKLLLTNALIFSASFYISSRLMTKFLEESRKKDKMTGRK